VRPPLYGRALSHKKATTLLLAVMTLHEARRGGTRTHREKPFISRHMLPARFGAIWGNGGLSVTGGAWWAT